MTEIPEHLLKRSKAAKTSKTGGDPGAAEADATETGGSGATTPVAATPAAPAVPPESLPNLDPEPPPPAPEPHYVAAAKARRRIPVWALPVVVALPVWAIGYAGTLQQPETEDPLLIESADLYSTKGCAGCHGGSGGGASGYAFTEGSVLETFPEPIDHMVHVARGSEAIAGQPYGAERADGQRREAGGRNQGPMPAQEDQLTLTELEMIVFHERATLSGEDTSIAGYEAWMDHMREAFESGEAAEIDLEFLLACADPEITPEATGAGSSDEAEPCPGPQPEGEGTEEAALGS